MSVQPAPTTQDPSDYPEPTVLRLTGDLGATTTEDLQNRLTDAVDRAPGDLYLDVHEVTGCTDQALTALTAARSRAKRRRTRLVVLDREDGVVASSLRRTGRHFRMPIHPDAASASEALAAERAVLRRVIGPAREDQVGPDGQPALANPHRRLVS